MDKNEIKVFILLKQSLYRQGLEHCLTGTEGIEFSGATEISETVLAALDMIRRMWLSWISMIQLLMG